MSTERQATPPPRVWITWDDAYPWNSPDMGGDEYVRADSFDTMRDALYVIAETISKSTLLERVNRGHYLLQDISKIANAALASIDGKDGGDGR